MSFSLSIKPRLSNAAFAFRGYNVTNLGRTPELLAHPVYAARMEQVLREGSQIASAALDRKIDLLARVKDRRETQGLESYEEDVALIMTVEMAQLGLLREYFGIELGGSRLAFGYSLGEAAALVATGVYALEDMLPIPLKLADDCTALAADTTMAVLFSKGPALDLAAVQRRCLEISQEGKGTLAISSLLSPNTLLLLGQSTTLERFKKDLATLFPGAYLRRNQHLWPPLHTPIMWQRQIPNRAAVLFETARGGFRLPSVALLSGVTGKASYNDYNSRELLHRWVDHPQRLWDMVYETLMAGVNLVVHVGPEPNLIPATFKRLSDNVSEQLSGKTWKSFGLRAASHMVRRAWLTPLLSSRAALLRAPFVDHCNLEDWLLEQKPG